MRLLIYLYKKRLCGLLASLPRPVLASLSNHLTVLFGWHLAVAVFTALFGALLAPSNAQHTWTGRANGQGMPIRAMSFRCFAGGRARAAQYIFPMRDRLKMCRIYATSSFAQMVNFFALGDGFDKKIVRPLMYLCSKKINLELSVAITIYRLCPIPTRRSVVKMFSGNVDGRKQTGQNLGINSDRIKIRHFVQSSFLNNLARGLSGVNYLISPASILA